MNRYLIVRRLGKGAFGEVFLVQRKCAVGQCDSQLYALKRVHLSVEDTQAKSAVDTEVKIAKDLQHPNVIRYVDSFADVSDLYFVMEYASGGDLHNFLRRAETPVPESQIWAWLSQLLRALCYLHSRHILHRDVKPANIFLTAQRSLKLGDFGASCHTETNEARAVIGTPYYIAPEVWGNAGYGAKADVWSLGCVVYEMCARKRPFHGSIGEVVWKITHGLYDKLEAGYSMKLVSVVVSMLKSKPEDRPAAQELLETIYTCSIPKSLKSPVRKVPCSVVHIDDSASIDQPKAAQESFHSLPTAPSSPAKFPHKDYQLTFTGFQDHCPVTHNRSVLIAKFLRKKLGPAVFAQLQTVLHSLADPAKELRIAPWKVESVCGRRNLSCVSLGIAFDAFSLP